MSFPSRIISRFEVIQPEDPEADVKQQQQRVSLTWRQVLNRTGDTTKAHGVLTNTSVAQLEEETNWASGTFYLK